MAAILAEAENPANDYERKRGAMPDKTKTVVVFESHEQTIIRRSRRTVSGQVLTDPIIARQSGRASSYPPEPPVLGKPKGHWWRTVALKGVTVLAQWSRLLKHGGKDQKNQQP